MGQILNKIFTSADDNLETFSLLWLDGLVNQTEENRQAQEELRATINQLKAFEDSNQCEQYIKAVPKEDRIVLIVSGQLGRQIVPRLHPIEQVLSIYVYCCNQNSNEQWSAAYSKVKAVVTNLRELIARIQFDHEKQQQDNMYESLPISIFDPKIVHEKLTTDLQGHLVHSQLLINCLLQVKSDVSDKNELISLSKNIYRKNRNEMKIIEEFERDYSPDRAIWWYTRNSFLSRLLNKALRTQNIDILFLFQFFIVDIRQQLEKYRRTAPIITYRSQFMSNDKFKKLKNSVGQFISINSFFSATMDTKKALSYLSNSDGLERVLFKIEADSRLGSDKPFANIKSLSFSGEDEIFFTLGSIFQVVKVFIDDQEIWQVHLKLYSDKSEQIYLIPDKNQLLSFGHVLMTMGKVDEAKIYYQRLHKGLPPGHPDEARCYEALGSIADEQGDYETGLKLYEQSLQINMKKWGNQHPDIASNYNSIGEIYRKLGDYAKAREYYDKALQAFGKDPAGKALAKQAVCYNNIGIVYQEQKQYKEALEYYQKAFEIRQKYFPSDETSLGMSYNNIGNAHYLLKLYDDAIFYYQEALKIYKKTLPPQHPKFASTYNNIGAIYDDQGKLDEALYHYKEARQIYCSINPPTHPNVIKIKENIDRIKLKMKK
ncbi:unnamed protein product [Rotaria sp. Silwood2]|nr:unnamed protein product [Rotaria sp. Silwood2]CAF2509779.1 unnamed protein product [Rotaria sp. Silwood2]CAF4060437.1 unnamed protein product [Rotaria sp. Silwood2]CAF4418587.1 unnamed protein product [Rotaria sp. Silwood2]